MATRQDIRNRCTEEGLMLMADVFEVIMDRGEANEDQVMAWLDSEGGDVMSSYEGFIVRGINALSDAIAGDCDVCGATPMEDQAGPSENWCKH